MVALFRVAGHLAEDVARGNGNLGVAGLRIFQQYFLHVHTVAVFHMGGQAFGPGVHAVQQFVVVDDVGRQNLDQ